MGRNPFTHFDALIADGRPLREGVGRNKMLGRPCCAPSNVALYARAWVEIKAAAVSAGYRSGRPLREGVGRNTGDKGGSSRSAGRPLREGVGRNCNNDKEQGDLPKVALYARAWVEM